jgi:hypothetical protein
MRTKSLNFVTGMTVIPGLTAFGSAFILLSCIQIIGYGHWGFSILLLLGILMVCSFDGVKFNMEKGTVKPYTLILGVLKFGRKQRMEKFPYLAVLRMTYRGSRRFNRLMPLGGGNKYAFYEVHMLSSTHLTKVEIQGCSTYEKALGIAEEIAAQTGMEIVKYNPQRAARRR